MRLQRLTMILAVVVFLSAGHSAVAADLTVFGSYWSPDEGDGAWGAGIRAGAPVLTEFVHLEGSATWFPESSQGPLDKIEFVPLDLGLALHPFIGSEIDPYLAAGVSYVFAEGSRYSLEDAWGSYVGGGFNFALSGNLALKTEIVMRFTEFDVVDYSRNDTFDANGVSCNAGLVLRF